MKTKTVCADTKRTKMKKFEQQCQIEIDAINKRLAKNKIYLTETNAEEIVYTINRLCNENENEEYVFANVWKGGIKIKFSCSVKEKVDSLIDKIHLIMNKYNCVYSVDDDMWYSYCKEVIFKIKTTDNKIIDYKISRYSRAVVLDVAGDLIQNIDLLDSIPQIIESQLELRLVFFNHNDKIVHYINDVKSFKIIKK